MKRLKINALLSKEGTSFVGKTVTVYGWVRTVRDQKTFAFVELNDGSCLANFQVIAKEAGELTTGCSIAATGEIIESPGGNQKLEMHAEKIEIYGTCPADYPLQKKRHTFEFLRTIAHLRPRTNTQGAVMRVRSKLADATHRFFQENGFLYIHTPIITASDCEGAGEMFQVTTLDLAKIPKDKPIDYKFDFFDKPTYLTVSGQLNAEAMACALTDVYTFAPTFRAENSNTSRHLAEFWMIEPEMAFADLNAVKELAESYLKYIFEVVLNECPEDIAFFNKFIDKGILERLQHIVTTPFAHMTYTEAVEILKKSSKKFEFPVEWGHDLQSEHERYISEEHCKSPVIVTDYPKDIKAFYMRDNEDGKTVAAIDILVPKIGEIIGGAQREERGDLLTEKIKKIGLDPEHMAWYLELRKYGTVPHGGFGAGFERLVQFVTGMENVRDVIPFPRAPGHADY